MDVNGVLKYSWDSCADETLTSDVVTRGPGEAYAPITIHAPGTIEGVTIIIVTDKTENNEYACVKTDEEGRYSFTNVDIGNYKVIEAFNFTEGTMPTGTTDFAQNKQPLTASVSIIPSDPSVEYVLSKGLEIYNGNRIVSLSSNTFPVDVRTTGVYDTRGFPDVLLESVDFFDAPQRCEAIVLSDFIQFQNAILTGNNVVSSADKGTFGTVEAGTRKSASYLSPGPYSTENISNFSYQSYGQNAPQSDYYSITNIAGASSFQRSWFDTADHTKGDETGRFILVNGDDRGKVFFKTNVSIEENTAYLFSCWAMNLLRFPDSVLPEFSIKIYDIDGNEIFTQCFNVDKPMTVTKVPTWRQIGTIIRPEDILNKTDLFIEFISEADEASGNDYAIDDVTVIALKRGVVALKAVKPYVENVELGGKITYECTIINSNDDENILHVMFKDLIQEGVYIKDDSFRITCSEIIDQPFIVEDMRFNDSTVDDVGIDVGNILSGLVAETDPYYVPLRLEKIPPNVSVIIKFTVEVKSVNKTPPYSNVKNRFRLQFLSELDAQDPDRSRAVASNEVITPVIFPELKAEKSVSKIVNNVPVLMEEDKYVLAGTEIMYSIKITNKGKADVKSLKITDSFDNLFLYDFPELAPDCTIRVTTQIEGPSESKQDTEQRVPCANISSFGSHGLEINDIYIPAAVENESGVENGVCTVRIYGKIKSDIN